MRLNQVSVAHVQVRVCRWIRHHSLDSQTSFTTPRKTWTTLSSVALRWVTASVAASELLSQYSYCGTKLSNCFSGGQWPALTIFILWQFPRREDPSLVSIFETPPKLERLEQDFQPFITERCYRALLYPPSLLNTQFADCIMYVYRLQINWEIKKNSCLCVAQFIAGDSDSLLW
jgi:hypothetical protein